MDNKTMQEQFNELIENTDYLHSAVDIDISDYNDADDLIEAVHVQISEYQLVYFDTAMEFLSENDASLQTSLGLAANYGLEVTELDSEELATLLFHDLAKEELEELREELEELYA